MGDLRQARWQRWRVNGEGTWLYAYYRIPDVGQERLKASSTRCGVLWRATDKFTRSFCLELGFKAQFGSSDHQRAQSARGFSMMDTSYHEALLHLPGPDAVGQSAGRRRDDAYADLFKVNKNAQTMSKTDLVDELRTLRARAEWVGVGRRGDRP